MGGIPRMYWSDNKCQCEGWYRSEMLNALIYIQILSTDICSYGTKVSTSFLLALKPQFLISVSRRIFLFKITSSPTRLDVDTDHALDVSYSKACHHFASNVSCNLATGARRYSVRLLKGCHWICIMYRGILRELILLLYCKWKKGIGSFLNPCIAFITSWYYDTVGVDCCSDCIWASLLNMNLKCIYPLRLRLGLWAGSVSGLNLT